MGRGGSPAGWPVAVTRFGARELATRPAERPARRPVPSRSEQIGLTVRGARAGRWATRVRAPGPAGPLASLSRGFRTQAGGTAGQLGPRPSCPRSHVAEVSDIQRCGHRLLPGGVEMASTCPKRSVQMCDVGELWPSGFAGSFHF